jgi:hypothetical protein
MLITILTTENQYKKPLLKSAINFLLPKSDTKTHYWKLLLEIVTKNY